MFSRLLVVLTLAIMALVPVAAEARNRTNDFFRNQFIAQSGYSGPTLDRYFSWRVSEDQELLPGLFLSIGGYSIEYNSRYGGLGALFNSSQARSVVAMALHNETSTPICFRANARISESRLADSLRAQSLGGYYILDPGEYGNIVMYDAPFAEPKGHINSRFYFWLPVNGSCGSVAPSDLTQFMAGPLSNEFRATDQLQRALGMMPPQSGSSASSPGASPSNSQVPAERRTAEWGLGLFNHSRGIDLTKYDSEWRGMKRLGSWSRFNGPFQSSFSVVQFGDGTYGALDNFFNDYRNTVCLYIVGDYDVGFVNPKTEFGSRGPTAVKPGSSGSPVAFRSSGTILRQPREQDWTLRYIVWRAPSYLATNADCAASVDVGKLAQLPPGALPGQIDVDPSLR